MELPELAASPPSDALFELISRLSHLGLSPEDRDSPTVAQTEEFFRNSWEAAENGLVARTQLLRVRPASRPAPRAFRFEIDLPYKRQEHAGAPIELDEGPLRGSIHYRQDLLLAAPGEPVVQVRFQDTSFLHPNFSRRWGVFCAGTFPPTRRCAWSRPIPAIARPIALPARVGGRAPPGPCPFPLGQGVRVASRFRSSRLQEQTAQA